MGYDGKREKGAGASLTPIWTSLERAVGLPKDLRD